MKDRIVLKDERRKMTGVSDPTWWRMERNGAAPKRRQISPGRVGWLESELVEWLESRPASTIDSPKRGDA